MMSVIAPSSTPTAGPLVLAMSSSSTRQPSALEYHHAEPSAGPDVQLAGDEVAVEVGAGVVAPAAELVGIARRAAGGAAHRDRSRAARRAARRRAGRRRWARSRPASRAAGSVCSSSSPSSSQCNVCAAQSTKYSRRRCSSQTRLSPQPSVNVPTRVISIGSPRPAVPACVARHHGRCRSGSSRAGFPGRPGRVRRRLPALPTRGEPHGSEHRRHLRDGRRARCPTKPALVVRASDGDEVRLTFAELDARVNQLAHALAELGVGAGDHVGCHLYDGNQYVETTLAAVQAARRAGERELPLRRRGAGLPVRQRRPEGGRHRARPRGPGRRAPRPGSNGRARCSWPTSATRPRWPSSPTTAPDVGERSPDDRYGLWTGGTTGHAQGRDVAPRGHLPLGDRRRRQPGARHRAGRATSTTWPPGSRRARPSRGRSPVPADARRRLLARSSRRCCRGRTRC